MKNGLSFCTEAFVGITEYICDENTGFKGEIKKRFKDFLVNEVDPDGRIVHLTRLYQPPNNSNTKNESKDDDQSSIFKHSEEGFVLLEKCSNVEVVESLKKMLKLSATTKQEDSTTLSSKEGIISSLILPPQDDKEKRREIHRIVREYFGDKLVTDTVDTMETPNSQGRKLAVRIVLKSAATAHRMDNNKIANSHRKRRKRKNRDGLVEVDWRSAKQSKEKTETPPKVLAFVLYKQNVESHYVINKISRFIGDSRCKVFIAGTKDKRGVTVQKATVTRCTPEQVLKSVTKGFNKGNVIAGNFESVKSPLHLGDLSGNVFNIIIRNVRSNGPSCKLDLPEQNSTKLAVEERISSLKCHGFINYFGMQRFGSRAIPTFEIGREVISGRFENACKLVLKEDSSDKDIVKEAKQHFKSGDLKAAMESMPYYMTAENAILRSLLEEGCPRYAIAFKRIPWNLRTLYTHSYQSFVWNSMVSRRKRLYGQEEPVVGDLVVSGSINGEKPTSKTSRIAVISQKDLDSRKWNIEDVVMPLPGYDVKYPEHRINADAYKNFLEGDGISPDRMMKKCCEYSLPGGYRAISAVPKDLEYEWIKYNDENDDLVLSDLDVVQGAAPIERSDTGKYLALRCRFFLPQSCYATMFLRELMHTTTEVSRMKT